MKEKDKELFLVSVLKIFIILFIGSFIVRLIGFDKFKFDIDNPIIHKITNIIYIGYIGQFIILYYTYYILMKLICKNNNKKIYHIITSIMTIINIAMQLMINDPNFSQLYSILNVLMIFIGPVFIDKKFLFKKTALVFILNLGYQVIALIVRNISYSGEYTKVYDFLLQFDYIILLAISYIVNEMKGSEYKWSLKAVGSCLHLQHSSKKSATKLPKESLSREEKVERLTENIYLVLVIVWNFFTLGCVILVCTLNTTLITTIFLLISFMMTKATFGKAFHMKSALSCFIVSNLVYFALSRVTVSVNISFLIPIILGVGLSYVTSFFVKETEKKEIKLYKGMKKEELLEIIKTKNLNKYEQNLLIDFYCNRMTLIKLSMKYNYSKDTIYYHKKKALKKLKED